MFLLYSSDGYIKRITVFTTSAQDSTEKMMTAISAETIAETTAETIQMATIEPETEVVTKSAAQKETMIRSEEEESGKLNNH